MQVQPSEEPEKSACPPCQLRIKWAWPKASFAVSIRALIGIGRCPSYNCSTKTFARVLQVPKSSLDTSWDCTFWRYLWGDQAC